MLWGSRCERSDKCDVDIMCVNGGPSLPTFSSLLHRQGISTTGCLPQSHFGWVFRYATDLLGSWQKSISTNALFYRSGNCLKPHHSMQYYCLTYCQFAWFWQILLTSQILRVTPSLWGPTSPESERLAPPSGLKCHQILSFYCVLAQAD